MKKKQNFDENYKYDIRDRDYFVSKFKDFINEEVDEAKTIHNQDVDQVDDMLHQLKSLFDEMMQNADYQDKIIVSKFKKYYINATKQLQVLRDFINDGWDSKWNY